MPSVHEFIEKRTNEDHYDITLRFIDVTDPELLKIDVDLLLESLSDEGYILGTSEDD